jgi:hypothetical protein
MRIDHSQPWQFEERGRQYPTVSNYDTKIELPGAQALEQGGVLQTLGLKNWKLGPKRDLLDRCVTVALSAPAGTIGLRHDAGHGMPGAKQVFEGGNRESWRSEEGDPQSRPCVGVHAHHVPAFISFRIFRTIRSRLIPRSRSTNNVPSR